MLTCSQPARSWSNQEELFTSSTFNRLPPFCTHCQTKIALFCVYFSEVIFLNNFFFFLCGAIFASFGFCTGQRLANGTSLWISRSFCDHCHRSLSWWQLIPILGWLLQHGRCHFCHFPIPATSTKLELGYGCALMFLAANLTVQTFFLEVLLQLWLLILATEDQANLQVNRSLLDGGAVVICLLGKQELLVILHNQWPATLALAGLFFLLEACGQFGRADTVCLLVLQMLTGLRFCSWVLLLAASLFCWTNRHAPVHQPHPFLPSLTAAAVIISVLASF